MSKELIDFLGIYRAKTIPRAPRSRAGTYHYSPSAKALAELQRWPARW